MAARRSHPRPQTRAPCLLSILFVAIGMVLGCAEDETANRDGHPPDRAAQLADAEPEGDPAPSEAMPAADPTIEDLARSEPLGRHLDDRYPASLATIVERRFLRVLTTRNAFDFFLEGGHRGGYQYEMVRKFTSFLNERNRVDPGELPIQFELVPVDNDQLIPLLLEGAGDLIAARLTITPDRAAQIGFSHPYLEVDEVLVAHDRSPEIKTLDDLSGQQVAVRASSSFAESLEALNTRLTSAGRAPVDVVHVDEELQSERILSLVAARRYPFSVADSVVAELLADVHPTLRIVDGVTLREGGEIAWATLPTARDLLAEMNTFLQRFEQGTLHGNLALKRFFESEKAIVSRVAKQEAGVTPGISPYDELFRKQAAAVGIDWRLVAAMAYQESGFDPLARNRWGAIGLMQIKRQTAREPYVGVQEIEGLEHVEDNIRAGLTYLSWIKGRYFDDDPEMRERDRLRMALAAYNAGPRTVLRARARARQQGLDPNRWFRHVELAMLGLGRSEAVQYVSEINQRYLSYVLLGIE